MACGPFHLFNMTVRDVVGQDFGRFLEMGVVQFSVEYYIKEFDRGQLSTLAGRRTGTRRRREGEHRERRHCARQPVGPDRERTVRRTAGRVLTGRDRAV